MECIGKTIKKEIEETTIDEIGEGAKGLRERVFVGKLTHPSHSPYYGSRSLSLSLSLSLLVLCLLTLILAFTFLSFTSSKM